MEKRSPPPKFANFEMVFCSNGTRAFAEGVLRSFVFGGNSDLPARDLQKDHQHSPRVAVATPLVPLEPTKTICDPSASNYN